MTQFIQSSLNKILTGFSTVNSSILATDTVLIAFNKTQGQINAKENTITAGTTSQYWRGDKSFQTLDTSIVTENTNLYYTQGRFDSSFAAKSTTNLTEGSNLYYTTDRWDAQLATKTTSNLSEGSNLYFTSIRVLSNVLTGYSVGSNTVLASTDTILQAFQKVQGQLNALSSSEVSSVSGTANRITSTGGVNPIIDIAGTYIGQASITTVGTLTSGTIGSGFTAIINARLANSTISGVALGSNLTDLVAGTGLLGLNYNGGTTRTFTIDSGVVWKTTGNSGLVDSVNNFIGTTDISRLRFRVNNIVSGIIDNSLFNTVLGGNSFYSFTTATGNSLFGYNIMPNATDASYNTSVGISSLSLNIHGNYNTSVGTNNLFSATGDGNSGFGLDGFFALSSGVYNSGFGYGVGRSATTANFLSLFGTQSFYNTTTGGNSVGIGYQSGITNITGSGLTIIGFQADVASGALTNSAAIGNGAIVSTSNTMVFGNSSITAFNFSGTSLLTASSIVANVNLGVNTGGIAAIAPLQIVETATTIQRGALHDQYSNGTSSSRITARKARGTFNSPAIIVTGDFLGSFAGFGYDGASFIEAGSIIIQSVGTIATGIIAGKLLLSTANASGVMTTALTIDQSQNSVFSGTLTATSFNGLNISTTTGTLTIANTKTLSISNTLTLSGTDSSTISFGTGGTVTYTSNDLSVFAATSSAQLAAVISDETGNGSLVFNNAPNLIAPTIGAAKATSIGIGTGSSFAAAPLQVINTSSSTTRGGVFDQYSNGATSSRINLRKSRGTFGSGTVITTGDELGAISSFGFDGSSFIESANIIMKSTGTISTNIVQGILQFNTANSSGTLVQALLIDQTQVATFANTIVGSINGNAATVTTNANLTGAITSVGNATLLGSFSSANLLSALSDKTGNGLNVFQTTPTITGLILTGSTLTVPTFNMLNGVLKTTPSAGDWEYDGALIYFSPNTTRRKIPIWDYTEVSGSNFTTSSTTLVNITGLSIALVANATYYFQANLQSQTNSTGTSNKFAVQFSAAGASVEAGHIGTLAASTTRSERITALNTGGGTFDTSGGTDGTHFIRGKITVGANAGNLTMQMLTAGVTPVATVYIGSSLQIWKTS